MQTTPALPWGYDVEGGVIQLSEAVTKEELLAGKIIPVFDVNERRVTGQFVVYPSDNKIYIEVSSGLVYRLPIDEYPTNTLRLERTEEFPQSGTMFTDVEIATFVTIPGMPMNLDEGPDVTLIFDRDVSYSELASLLLVQWAAAEGQQFISILPTVYENNIAWVGSNGRFSIQKFEGSVRTITGNMQGGGNPQMNIQLQ